MNLNVFWIKFPGFSEIAAGQIDIEKSGDHTQRKNPFLGGQQARQVHRPISKSSFSFAWFCTLSLPPASKAECFKRLRKKLVARSNWEVKTQQRMSFSAVCTSFGYFLWTRSRYGIAWLNLRAKKIDFPTYDPFRVHLLLN